EQPLDALRVEDDLEKRAMRKCKLGRLGGGAGPDAVEFEPAAQCRHAFAHLADEFVSLDERQPSRFLVHLNFTGQELPIAQRAHAGTLLNHTARRATRFGRFREFPAAPTLIARRQTHAVPNGLSLPRGLDHLGAIVPVLLFDAAPPAGGEPARVVPFLETPPGKRMRFGQLEPILVSRAVAALLGIT